MASRALAAFLGSPHRVAGAGAQPAPSLSIDVRAERGRCCIHVAGLPVATVDEEVSLPPLLDAIACEFAVNSTAGFAAFHAALVEVGGRRVMICGPSRSGKSTVAAWCSVQGATYLGDEAVFVRFDDGMSAAYAKAATIKEGSFPLFSMAAAEYRHISRGPVRYFFPERIPAGERTLAPLSLLMFSEFEEGGEGATNRIEPELAATGLVQQAFGGLERDGKVLHTIADLAKLPACHVRYAHPSQAHRAMLDALGL
jgi:hypothetical protein